MKKPKPISVPSSQIAVYAFFVTLGSSFARDYFKSQNLHWLAIDLLTGLMCGVLAVAISWILGLSHKAKN